MNPFECCHKCVAPKRYPGCAGSCEEYKEARIKWETQKAHIKKERDQEAAVHSVRTRSGRIRSPKD